MAGNCKSSRKIQHANGEGHSGEWKHGGATCSGGRGLMATKLRRKTPHPTHSNSSFSLCTSLSFRKGSHNGSFNGNFLNHGGGKTVAEGNNNSELFLPPSSLLLQRTPQIGLHLSSVLLFSEINGDDGGGFWK
ncbi:hypothetical protein PIB30_091927 [Stylosanthes scabra]|uniref:Uncharacterized protein n=1 Tax=Stylosanthes scabra TaxID=79078 RepID=A0ABU6TU43_9FABA|nr:hypothetical protein [Stylosanthes scabra]